MEGKEERREGVGYIRVYRNGRQAKSSQDETRRKHYTVVKEKT
jgi:hypothetical protein